MARSFGNSALNFLSRGSRLIASDPRPISVAVWFKAAGHKTNQPILTNDYPQLNPNLYIAIRESGGFETLSLYTSASGDYVNSTAFVLSTTDWTHCGWTFNSDNAVGFYVNGVAFGTATRALSAAIQNAAAIGTLDGALTGFEINGSLGEFAVWNAILDANEWAALALRISPMRIRPANLVNYLPIYGIASPENDLRDSTTWTVNGSPAPSENPPVQPPFLSDFGVPYVVGGAGGQTISPSAIESTAAVGSHALTGAATISPSGIDSTVAIGSHTLSGAATISPSGVDSTAQVGTPDLSGLATISPSSIGSTATVGEPALTSAATISPVGVASTSSIGSPTLSPGGVTISPSGISSTTLVGNPSVAESGTTISPVGIPSTVSVGSPWITLIESPECIRDWNIDDVVLTSSQVIIEQMTLPRSTGTPSGDHDWTI